MTKIIIISGFLGAGKTTFIKALLPHMDDLSKVAIVENDFGEINLDANMIGEFDIQIETFTSGCICCSLSGDFKAGIKALINEKKPELLLIEPSGVGKVSDILNSLKEIALPIEIQNIITIIDGQKGEIYLENFTEFFEDQIHHANLLVLTRENWPELPSTNDQSIVFLKNEEISSDLSKMILDNSISIDILNDLMINEGESHHSSSNSQHHDKGHDCHCEHQHEEHHTEEHDSSCGHHHTGDRDCSCGHHHSREHDSSCGHQFEEASHTFSTVTILDLPTLSLDSWKKKFSFLEGHKEIIRCKGIIPTQDGHYILQYTPSELHLMPTSLDKTGLVFIGTSLDQATIIRKLEKENE